MPTSTRPYFPIISRRLHEEPQFIIRTMCISAESAEIFEQLFDNAMDKIRAIRACDKTLAGEISYHFEQGKFIAFIPYWITERQKDFDMSLSPEALRALELQSYETGHLLRRIS